MSEFRNKGERDAAAQALGYQKRKPTQWTNIPPALSGRQVEGTSGTTGLGILGLGKYEMPDGSYQVSWGLAQPALDAYRSMRYGLGFEQDPAAPPGYVSEDAISRGAFGAAGFAATGGIAASKVPGAMPRNAVGMFAGPKAKTAKHAAMDLAKKMHSEGMSRDEIWKATWAKYGQGWFQGDDGKWAFEISDHNSRLKKGAAAIYSDPDAAGKQGQLGDLFSHQRLMGERGAYPELKSITANLNKDEPYGGGYMAMYDNLRVNAGDPDMARDIALHEIQHAIERKEGWGRGGNLSTKYDQDYKTKIKPLEQQKDKLKAEIEGLFEEAARVRGEYDNSFFTFSSPIKKLEKIKAEREKKTKQLRSIWSQIERVENDHLYRPKASTQEAIDYYLRLKGEVFARTTQARKDMTPEQRRAIPPWLDYDVPENSQIVIFDD